MYDLDTKIFFIRMHANFHCSIKNIYNVRKLNNISTIRINLLIIFGQNWEIPIIVGPFVFWLFLERPLTKMF